MGEFLEFVKSLEPRWETDDPELTELYEFLLTRS